MPSLTRPGNLLVLIIVMLPVTAAAWLASAYPVPGVGSVLNLLGRLAGVMGMTMMLVAAVVSIRVPRFDQPFGGLSELWKVHHWLGSGAFLLLMAHPILLALAVVPQSPQAGADLLLPPAAATASWIGWAALVAMMAFLAPTFSFFDAAHYQRWKGLHGISGLAVLLAFGHTLMLGRSLPVWVWWGLGLLALAALLFRLVWRKWRQGRTFRITAVTPLADRVVELALVPQNGKPLVYEAGQFVYLAPLDATLTAGRGEEHPYTIASAPQDTLLRIAVKDLGDASGALQQVPIGSLATIDGPYGRFFEAADSAPQLWLGGGIGITPFVGRARWMAALASATDVHLIYCANDSGRAYYLEELNAIASSLPHFHVWPHYFSDEGPLQVRWVQARCGDAVSRLVHACGPAPLLELMATINRELGIPASHYKSEAFDFL